MTPHCSAVPSRPPRNGTSVGTSQKGEEEKGREEPSHAAAITLHKVGVRRWRGDYLDIRSMAGFMAQPALRPRARMIPETLARQYDIECFL